MSREIKFRIWHPRDKNFYTSDNSRIFRLHLNGKLEAIGGIEFAPESGCIVEQYTGLKDKNGVEIFEGDILRDGKGSDGKVFYNPNIASFLLDSGGETFYLNEGKPQRGPKLQYTQIIGNIHEERTDA